MVYKGPKELLSLCETMTIYKDPKTLLSLYETMTIYCHTPIPDPTRMADPNQVRGARLCTGTLIDRFFLRAELVPVVIQTISIITKIIYIYKRTTTGVVSLKIYTHILSPIYLYKPLYVYMSNTNIRDCGSSAASTYL